jgi:hypothetical protein
MATLTVTPAALACIRERIEHERIERPVVSVSWEHGWADLHRGTAGEVIWDRPKPGWVAVVLDLAELEAAGVSWTRPVAELEGYSFSLNGKAEAPQLEGCTLTCEDGKLVVYEQAI